MTSALKTGAALTLAIKFVAATVSYGFVYSLSQMMSIKDFGFVGALISSAFLLSIVGAMGQQIAILRFIPPLRVQGKYGEVGATITRAFRINLLGGLSICTLGAMGGFLARWLGHGGAWVPFTLGLTLVPLIGWIDMQASLARAYRGIAIGLIPKEVLWRALSALAVLLIYLMAGQRPVSLTTVIWVLITVLALLIFVQSRLMQTRLNTPSLIAASAQAPAPEWRKTMVPFWIFSVSAVYFTNIDVALVGLLFGGAEAGQYFVANRVAQALAFFLISYNIAIGPILSESYHTGRFDEVARATSHVAFWAFVPTIILASILIIWAAPILGLFGPEFVTASGTLRILIAAGVVNAIFGPADILLNMCGEDRKAMKISLMTMAVGTIIVIALGYFAGPGGVAVGVLISVAGRKGASWLAARQTLGVSTDIVSAALHLFRQKESA